MLPIVLKYWLQEKTKRVNFIERVLRQCLHTFKIEFQKFLMNSTELMMDSELVLDGNTVLLKSGMLLELPKELK